jgi:AcrR family transcriptional regulator
MALHRHTVLRAALEVVDAEGVESLSMRRLAALLDVTPMAIYNHVHDRADLLDGVADLLAREIGRPSNRWGWRRRLRAVLHGTRAVCLAHPAAIPLLQGARSLTPALLQPAEIALEALEDAGLRPASARTAWAALIGLTYGHVAYELAGHLRGPGEGRGTLDGAAFPRIAAMAAAPPFDWDRAFDRALNALIEGLVSAHHVSRRSPSALFAAQPEGVRERP